MPRKKYDKKAYLAGIFVVFASLFGLYYSYISYDDLKMAFPGNYYIMALYYFFVVLYILFAIAGILIICGAYLYFKEQKTLKDFEAKPQKPTS